MGKRLWREIDALRAQLDAFDGRAPVRAASMPKTPEPPPPIADLISAMGAGTAMMTVPLAAYAFVLDRVHNHAAEISPMLLGQVLVLQAWEMISAYMVAWVATKLISHFIKGGDKIGLTVCIWAILLATVIPIIDNLPNLVKDPKVTPQADEISAMYN